MSTTPTILAASNASGPAEKTTPVVNLADHISRTRRMVGVAADPQGTATPWMGYQPDHVPNQASKVPRRRSPANQTLIATATARVRPIPANQSLHAAADELNTATGPEQQLTTALSRLVGVDVVLIDFPGWVSTITISAPTATRKEISRIPEMLDAVEAVHEESHPDLRFTGVVASIVPLGSQGRIYNDVTGVLHSTHDAHMAPPVRRSASVAKAHAQRVPRPSWSPYDRVTQDDQAVLEWLQGQELL